nr:hypothetical protein Itr_chr07CG10970 [Ipomoea trifida]
MFGNSIPTSENTIVSKTSRKIFFKKIGKLEYDYQREEVMHQEQSPPSVVSTVRGGVGEGRARLGGVAVGGAAAAEEERRWRCVGRWLCEGGSPAGGCAL